MKNAETVDPNSGEMYLKNDTTCRSIGCDDVVDAFISEIGRGGLEMGPVD
jgi:hypothetical protein